MTPGHLIVGDDGRPRCPWGAAPEIYLEYHDLEWGRPVIDDDQLFEKLCLEGFQAGLSWLTILRKREAFRAGFAGFRIAEVAEFGEADVERLVNDAGIVRHRGKIEAAIANAGAALEVQVVEGSLAGWIWSYAPEPRLEPPLSMADLMSSTVESTDLAKELKVRGFRFVGPTTVFALFQAMGLVNDHLDRCWVRDEVETARATCLGPAVPPLD